MSLSMGPLSLLPDGLVGGMLIGLSAATLLLGNGRILGAAGIARSFLHQSPLATLFSRDPDTAWRLHFLAAFCLASGLFQKHAETSGSGGGGEAASVVSSAGYALAGLLVGFGTTMGNGCTSGHGICGLARFSKRSLSAVLAFMATGMLTSTVCEPDCPWIREPSGSTGGPHLAWIGKGLTGALVAASGYASLFPFASAASASPRDKKEGTPPQQPPGVRSTLVAWASGGLFSLGLGLSGMVKHKHIAGFLDAKGLANGTWDPTLVFVMAGGLLVSTASYQFVPGFNVLWKNAPALSEPWSSKQYQVPATTTIDKKLLLGAALFGLGWGIGGVCPGPGVYHAATGNPSVLAYWWPCFWLGSWLPSLL